LTELAGSAIPSATAAVVLVNTDQRDLTLACLGSLAKSSVRFGLTIVVDNASSDGSAEAIADSFPSVVVLRQPENRGFPAAANAGVAHVLGTPADYIWVLNNDTEVASNAAEQLITALSATDGAGVACPKIYFAEPRDVLWFAGGDIELKAPMGAHHRGLGERDKGSYDQPCAISFINGCAPMFHRRILERHRLFDESFFIYCEDLDLSIRLARSGVTCLYEPRAVIWHKVSQSFVKTARAGRQTYLLVRNRFIVQRRYCSTASVIALLGRYLVGSVARGAYWTAVSNGDCSRIRGLARGIIDGLRTKVVV